MDLEQILSMWEKDSVIDDVLLDDASKKIPSIHAKYLTLHGQFSLLSKKKVLELKKATHLKWLYYSGKAKPEEYEDKPFPYKVMYGTGLMWMMTFRRFRHNWITMIRFLTPLMIY